MEDDGIQNLGFREGNVPAKDASTESEKEMDGHEDELLGEEDNSEDGEFVMRFEGDVNPIDFMEEDAFGVQPFQRFERLEYEHLAERKRKAEKSDLREGSPKKSREDGVFGASLDELMEAMNYGDQRKLKKKSKRRGRPRGSKRKLPPEVNQMLMEGQLLYANGRYKEAISVLTKAVYLFPNLPEAFHTLGLAYDANGEKQKAMGFYMLAAVMKPKDLNLWKVLYEWSLEEGNTARAIYCLSKGIMADPQDIKLKYRRGAHYLELRDHEKAAKSFDQISQLCPEDTEALTTAAKSYQLCGQTERAVTILEEYLKCHPTESDLNILDMLAAMLMRNNDYVKALQHIEQAQFVHCPRKELPLHLATKAGICHLHLGNIEKANIFFRGFRTENVCDHVNLIIEIAAAHKNLGHYESALDYYLMLEKSQGQEHKDGNLHHVIAQCYCSLKRREEAIWYFYKALSSRNYSVDARLTLASLLLEDGKENEAIALLSPTDLDLAQNMSSDSGKLWWLSDKVKLKLANIYRSKGMLQEFVDTIFPLIDQSLNIEAANKGVKAKRKIPKSVLLERAKMLDSQQADNVLRGIRPIASASDMLKAVRAKKTLLKMSTTKEEMKAKSKAAGLAWESEDSDEEEAPRKERRNPPLPELLILKDDENHQLIIDICKALASLHKYQEALDVIKLTLSLASNRMSVERKQELIRFGAQVTYTLLDPKCGYDIVRNIVLQHPQSIAAWSSYYKVVSKQGIQHSKHSKFLHRLRDKHKDCIPPILIAGHQFTTINQHQAAAKEYLGAYKILPESPFINLCVGTSLINLALDFRLQNKHLCILQGLAFLYNNLRLCGKSQEALYNIARAYHHVGLVSLAASYYEKVIGTPEKDYPIPRVLYENSDIGESLMPGYCNIKREAAYNLHLIYKSSGAFDLARQVLRDHCTL